jgi:phage shock protein PspC (stress-responsive transcriptional regulator)
MGPVDGAAGEAASSPAAVGVGAGAGANAEAGFGIGIGAGDADKGNAGAGSATGAPKRLYQIREGAMISGVCKGLAAYFNIDVTIVRLIFVGLAVLTYGAWIGAYVVMMFVIPFAKTSEERAAAFGLPFSAQDLIDQAKQNYAGFKNKKQWKRHWKQQRRQWRHGIRERAHTWSHNLREQAHTWDPAVHDNIGEATRIWGGFMAPIFGIVTFGLFVLMGFAIFSLLKTGMIGGWALPVGIPLWAGVVGLVVAFHILTSPLHDAHHAAHYSSKYGYVGSSHHCYGALGGTIWLAVIVVGVWFGYHHVPQIHDFIQGLPGIWHDMLYSLRNHPQV